MKRLRLDLIIRESQEELKKYNMRHIKGYKVFEGIVNPIQDYLTDFIDLYDFEIETPDMGVCDLTLKSTDYDPHRILSLYQELISRLADDDYELKGGSHTYISFYKEMVHIRIERVVKKSSDEYKFESEDQELAYKSILKVISPKKLRLDQINNGFMKFSKMDSKFSSTYQWITIDRSGRVFFPILRGSLSQRRSQLPFDERDINWFKKLLQLDKDGYNTSEYNLMAKITQEELREKYN